ncbi:MAG: hypothetical protein ACOYMA_00475 [Bacteroidia bacterium]
MALKLKQAGIQPLGQFDGYDENYLTIKGGEVGRWVAVPYTYPGSLDKAASDVFDGYSGTPVHYRPAVSRALESTGGSSTYRPLFLLDEGTVGYGTMFGTVVGGVVGQVVPNPSNLSNVTVLGPHTAAGSGKVTLWDKPGLYGVTLDAVAPSVDVVVSNPMPGDPLFADTLGRLTLTAGESFDTGAGGETIVGRFAEFTTNGSLVTTPSYVALPTVVRQFTEMLFHFRIEN